MCPRIVNHGQQPIQNPRPTEQATAATTAARKKPPQREQAVAAALPQDQYKPGAATASNARGESATSRPIRKRDRSQITARRQQRPSQGQPAAAGPGAAPPVAGQAQTKDLDGTGRVTTGPTSPGTLDWSRSPALPQATRDQLVREAGSDPQVGGQLQQIAQHPLYGQLDEPQRAQLLEVYANASAEGRAELPTLLGRQVEVGSGDPRPTAPALLTGDNARPQRTLLDNLHRLSTQPLHESVTSRAKLLGGAIREAAQPSWHLDQGRVGTCAPTTMQSHLIQNTPSEYVRLLGGLAGPSRSVQMANGAQLDAARNDTAPKPTVPDPRGGPGATQPDTRSPGERIFQSALQQHGDRMDTPGAVFDANTDRAGLGDDQIAHVMQGLYNRPYASTTVRPQGKASKPGSDVAQRNALDSQVERELRSGHGPVPAALLWGGGSHEVMVTQVQDDRVYFRNPHGSRAARGEAYRDGRSFGNPPRRVEDSQSGLESMSRAEFRRHLDGVVAGPPVGGR
jgi:hypothetical protein